MTNPTDILVELATAVMAVVKTVDLEHDLSTALSSITVTCSGPGQFKIRIDSEADVDNLRLDAAIHSAIQGETSEA